MLRIIAGTVKNRRLEVPDSARPITDRIRTSIFDTIIDFIPNAKVLDLFSGSGAFAIEALSRGASEAVLLERSSKAVEIIKRNLIHVKFADQAKVINTTVEEYLADDREEENYDLIMLDPPFALEPHKKLRIVLAAANLLSSEGLLIFRYPEKEEYLDKLPGFEMVFSKKYGISRVNYYKRTSQT
jgi:16S rRNA (guanine(966)-N(2))-methyltransferase RsmD